MKAKSGHPRIPVPDLITEGNDRIYACGKDREELVKGGLDWSLVEELDRLTTACIRAQTDWLIFKENGKTIVSNLKKLHKEAVKTRANLAGIIRDTPEMKESGGTLPWFGKNKKIAECIQDLHDLAFTAQRIRKSNPHSIKEEIINEALERHEILRVKSIERELLKDKSKECRGRRDKAAREMKKTLDTIQKAARNIFIDNPEKASRYTFAYYIKLNMNRPIPQKNKQKNK